MHRQSILIILFFSISLYACKTKHSYEIKKSIIAPKAMVVTAHPHATKVGLDILKQGGNAVDAAIAVQFALAVTYPRAGNIGGGGFMVIRNADGTSNTLDYREKAPLKSYRDMYLDSLGNVVPGLSRSGHLAVGVPGTVDGLFTSHKRYGKLKDFSLLINPAIKLARDGYHLTKAEVDRLNKFRPDFIEHNELPIPFVKDSKWQVGDLLVQKDLAHTLELIRDNGRDGFYGGETAAKIVDQMNQSNGIISSQDLKKYQSKWRAPIEATYKNYKIISMPPPSSGGIALAQLLKLVAPYPLSQWGFQSKETVHTMVEAERRVYADRAKHLGDSDYWNVPIDTLLDSLYLINRMLDFDQAQASSSDSILAGNFKVGLESFETTHISIVDEMGNAVAVTTTLNSNFGSKVLVKGAGFFLNNEMDDFSAKPGVPNQFGLIGNEANAIEPEKRMLSSMTPTIIEKDGSLFMLLGTPGGSTIITSVFQVFLNVAEFGMPLDEAVFAKRFHHQWLPDVIMVEEGKISTTLKDDLEKMGHQLELKKYIGLVKAIHVLEDGNLHGVGDNRSEDHVAGY